MTQITANLKEKKTETNCFGVTVLALDGLTKKHFGHCALLKIFPSDHQVRLRLHKTGSVWNLYEISTDKPCVYTGRGRSALARFSYLLNNWLDCLYVKI